MTPDAAYDYVRFIGPRVQLAPPPSGRYVSLLFYVVQDYYSHKVKRPGSYISMEPSTDLDGYDDSSLVGNESLAELTLACKVQFASQAAITRLSCLRLHCHDQKPSRKKIGS
ncbi:hypothetical protein Acr_00g0062240 [Actinidia rufa]|uniref:Uncharacterized protein n=1 Tax=Actinidia rufa TaxID=165716 RepID=A0A7J0DNW2_9ERIC|nr:hypothetical protein Acr_00g0062240 [Actinidia rufa]